MRRGEAKRGWQCSICIAVSLSQGFLVLFHSTWNTVVAGMLLSLTYLKTVQLLRPFKDPELNRIKETSVWQIFFVFLIALLIKTEEIDSNSLTACLLLVFFFHFFLLLGKYVVRYWERRVAKSPGEADSEAEMVTIKISSTLTSAVMSTGADSLVVNQSGGSSGGGVGTEVATADHAKDDVACPDGESYIHSPFHPKPALVEPQP